MLGFVLGLATVAAGCTPPDPKAELEVHDIDAYWAVDPSVGGTQYLAPAVQFKVRNKGKAAQRAVHANVVFHRVGEAQTWGSGFWAQDYPASKPVEPGQSLSITIKSDARYTSPGAPEAMFQHEAFKDVRFDLFLRLGSSPWVKFGDVPVPRRIGTKGVQDDLAQPPFSPRLPTPPPQLMATPTPAAPPTAPPRR